MSKKHWKKSPSASGAESRFVDSLSYVDNEIYNALLLHHYMPEKILYERNPYAGGFSMMMQFADGLFEMLSFEVDKGGRESMEFFERMSYERQPMSRDDTMHLKMVLIRTGPVFTVRDWLQAHGS